MAMIKGREEQILASEHFSPRLSSEYLERYQMLIDRLSRVLPANYVSFIKKEISTTEDTTAEDLEQLKYLATLNVLIDLAQQGWVFNISENELYLRMEDDNRSDKDIQRYRLSAERNAQFQNRSVINFISRLEKEHEYKGKTISIKNLIGNPAIILHAIKSKQKICDPYIQEATPNTRDIFTGYKLSEIWRYFRYTWSIPYKTMPGRNMYYLVRDRLQPYHPVIGIFALGNSVLNLTVRDDDIGWTIEAIKHNLKIRSEETFCEQIVSGTDGGKIKTRRTTPAESQEEYKQRILLYSERIIQLLEQSLRTAISEIYSITVKKHIAIVEFEEPESKSGAYKGIDEFANQTYELLTIGSKEIQSILSNIPFDDSTEKTNDQRTEENTSDVNANAETQIPNKTITSQQIEQQKKTNNDPKTDSSSTVAESVNLSEENQKRLEEKCSRLNSVFRAYGIKAYPVSPENVLEAARFTRFQVQLRTGEVETSITKRIRDIERELEAEGEILVDHIKGTKYLAVDVPFSGDSKPIKLLDHLKLLDESNMRLPFIAGQLPDGHFDITDLAAAPHMLIAGTTGSGKTIFLYSIIVSLLHKYSSDELSLLIIDPKMTDFVFFENLPHLYCGKVVTNAEEALDMLKRINEQDKEERTEALKTCRSRDIESYNEKNPNNKMKRLVVIIDEYSDLIQAAQLKEMRKEFESNLLQLLQRVRNLGIHLIIATQRPSAQIVTGALKAVIPFRVSFRLPSHTDSQTILDMPGAENLLGKGDMLMVTESDTKRMQGLFITEDELETYLNSKQE